MEKTNIESLKIGDKLKIVKTGDFIRRDYSKIGDVVEIKSFSPPIHTSVYLKYITFTNGDFCGTDGDFVSFESIKLFPENWAIKGSEKTVNLITKFKESEIFYSNFKGNITTMYYYLNDNSIRGSERLLNGYTVVDVETVEDHYFPKIQKWAIKPENPEQGKIVREWIEQYKYYNPGKETDYYWHYPAYEESYYCNYNIQNGYKKITFEEFEKDILKKNQMKQTGWKLKEEYRSLEKAAAIIADQYLKGWWQQNASDNLSTRGWNFTSEGGGPNSVVENLRKAGVLDVWFEPVYEKEIINYRVGDYLYCKEDFLMESGEKRFTKGKIYKSENLDCLTNDAGNPLHRMSPNYSHKGKHFSEYFRMATEEETKKFRFKVGTWVVVVEGGYGASGCNGQTGQITDKPSNHGSEGDIHVLLPNGEVWGLSSEYYKIREATQEEIKLAEKVELKLGDKKITIKIYKDGVEAEGYNIDVLSLNRLVNDMGGSNYYNLPWKTFTTTVKIGCCLFSREELLKVLEVYDGINNTYYSVKLI